MSYYDEDTGEYVGYDPYEAHDRRLLEEKYNHTNVPTPKELISHLYYRGMVEKSKKYIEEPSYDGDDFLTAYMTGFAKACYDAFGDLGKAMELISEDTMRNEGKARVIRTEKEHITREGMESFIVYMRVDGELEVLGVFYDEKYADKFIDAIG